MKSKDLFENNFLAIAKLTILLSCLVLFSHQVSFAMEQQSFIRIESDSFVRNGRSFKFIGATAVNLLLYDDWGIDIEKCVRTAKENNISVLRFYMDWKWAKYEDFDAILDLLAKYKMYAILSLTDCCCSSSFPTLEKYFEVHTPFCNINDSKSLGAFKRRIKQIIERRNSVNGKVYRDDPTIMAWEIANELEYWHFSKSVVHRWVEEASNYVKSLDKNHLVTIGISTDSPEFAQDVSIYQMFNVPALDFFSFHVYPSSQHVNTGKELPRREDVGKIGHIAKGFISLGKPVIMGEFGFSNSTDLNFKFRTDPRTENLYNVAMKKYMDTAFLAGCSGVMFWGWGVAEEKSIPMWWNKESHSVSDYKFCDFLKKYNIPKDGHNLEK